MNIEMLRRVARDIERSVDWRDISVTTQEGGIMAKENKEDREPVVVTIDDVAYAEEVTITKGGTTLKFDRNQAVALSRFIANIQWGGTTKERY